MKKLNALRTLLLISIMTTFPQKKSELPYYQIPEYPKEYSAETVTARMIDGLGFRYFWATDSLREEDLIFRPTEESRTSGETIDHIYGLSKVIVNAIAQVPNDRSVEEPEYTFEEKRKLTLENFKRASDILKSSNKGAIEDYMLIFKREDGSQSSYPFWNNLNGPIADAIWHVGQVVSHRRTSGNPFNSKVSVLQGKLRE